jgi:hypothetical protein
VRTPGSASVGYAPETPPADPKALSAYLDKELNRIAAVIQLLAAGHIDRSHVAPTKPRDGDIRFADGSDWNPGSGAGLYYYDANTPGWVFIA